MKEQILDEIRIEITNKCNLNCDYCYTKKVEHGKNEISFEEIEKVTKNAKKQGLKTISITGGEPIFRYDLLKQLIEYCNSEGINTGLLTNGTLINQNIANELKESGLSWVRISIDGFNQESNLKTRKGDFEKIINSFKYFKKEEIPTILRTTATSKNLDYLENIVKLGIELGVERVEIQPYIFLGNELDKKYVIFLKDHIETAEKLIDLRKEVKDDVKVVLYSDWFEFVVPSYDGTEPCFSKCGKDFMFISSIGRIQTCGPSSNILGSIIKDNFLDIFNNSDFLKKIRDPKPFGICKKCDVFEICKPCKASTYNVYGSINNSPVQCPKVREKEGILI